jgi:CYTH domain-containing protein
LCERPLLEKRRYHFEHDGRTWEVDEFLGANEGLVVAEIELDTPDAEFSMPSWIGIEVTNDSRYFNSNLSMSPFTTWK